MARRAPGPGRVVVRVESRSDAAAIIASLRRTPSVTTPTSATPTARALGSHSTTPQHHAGSSSRGGAHSASPALGLSGSVAASAPRSHSARELGRSDDGDDAGSATGAALTMEEWNAMQRSTLRRARKEQEEADEYGIAKGLAASGASRDGVWRGQQRGAKDGTADAGLRRASPCALPGIRSGSPGMAPIREAHGRSVAASSARRGVRGGSSPSRSLRRSRTGAQRGALLCTAPDIVHAGRTCACVLACVLTWCSWRVAHFNQNLPTALCCHRARAPVLPGSHAAPRLVMVLACSLGPSQREGAC